MPFFAISIDNLKKWVYNVIKYVKDVLQMPIYKRINLNVPEELYEKISLVAGRLNVNRTAWCMMTLSQGVQASDLTKTMSELNEMIRVASAGETEK